MSRAFVFPGQASQAVGMGREVAEAFAVAKEIFEEIDEALKQNLSRLMFQGPEEELVLTENAQPAIMAVSLAVIRVLSEDGGIDLSQTAAFVAGHSLGEYSALAAVGCLSVTDTAALLKTRGRAMQEAVPLGEGQAADLYLVVQVAPDPRFEREEDDLYTEVTVDLYTAVLGGEVRVPTPAGDVMLTIPPGTQPGQTFRLRGRGMPHLGHPEQHGDLYVRVKVEIPRHLSPRERELFRQLAALRRP